jgi:hypothetical protein
LAERGIGKKGDKGKIKEKYQDFIQVGDPLEDRM